MTRCSGLLLAGEAYSLNVPRFQRVTGLASPTHPGVLNALSYQAPVRYPPGVHEREER